MIHLALPESNAFTIHTADLAIGIDSDVGAVVLGLTTPDNRYLMQMAPQQAASRAGGWIELIRQDLATMNLADGHLGRDIAKLEALGFA